MAYRYCMRCKKWTQMPRSSYIIQETTRIYKTLYEVRCTRLRSIDAKHDSKNIRDIQCCRSNSKKVSQTKLALYVFGFV